MPLNKKNHSVKRVGIWTIFYNKILLYLSLIKVIYKIAYINISFNSIPFEDNTNVLL